MFGSSAANRYVVSFQDTSFNLLANWPRERVSRNPVLGTIAEDVKKLVGFAEMRFRGLLLHHAPLGERPPARLKTPARADRLRHGVKRRVATDLLERRPDHCTSGRRSDLSSQEGKEVTSPGSRSGGDDESGGSKAGRGGFRPRTRFRCLQMEKPAPFLPGLGPSAPGLALALRTI